MLNSREMRAFDVYCSRYRIRNKSEFLRTTLIKTIIQRFEDEHPSLWEEPEPTLFSHESFVNKVVKAGSFDQEYLK